MVVVFTADCHVLFLMMIGLPQFSSNEFTILAVHDGITAKQAIPAFIAAENFVNDLEQFSFHFSHLIINNDLNSTFEKICSQLSTSSSTRKPTIAIIDTTEFGSVISASNLMNGSFITIPISFTSIKAHSQLRENQLHILPPNLILCKSLRNFISTLHSPSLFILHDKNFVCANDVLTNITTHQLSLNEIAIENKLTSITFMNKTSVILMGSYVFINTLLRKASVDNIFRNISYVYAFSKEELSHLQQPCNTTYSLAILEVKLHNKTRLDQLQLKYSSELSTIPQIDFLFYFDIGVASLFTCAHFFNDKEINPFINLSTKFNHQLVQKITLLPSPYGSFYLKNNKLQQNFTIQVTQPIDKENPQNHLDQQKKTPLKLSALKDAIEYRVVVSDFPPFIYKGNSLNKQFYGYCIDLLKKLSETLQFNYTLYESDFGILPEINKNHTWTGVFKELIEKRADIALAPMSIMKERERVVDFTIPFYDSVGITILMRRPASSNSLFQFLTVLEKNVWGCILAAYFLTSFLLCLFDRFSPYSYQNNKKKYINNKNYNDEDNHEFTLKESLWFCIVSLTPLGGVEAPKSASGRIMVATWWLFGFIVIASYTANLAAYLTVSRNDKAVYTLDDLYRQHQLKYAPINGSVSMTYFERMAYIENKFHQYWTNITTNSFDPEERVRMAVWEYPISDKYTKLWQLMKETGLPKTLEEGVQRVKNENFALLAEETELKYETLINCDFITVGEEFSRKPYALAVQKGSPLKHELSLGILKLQTERVLEDLKDKWWKGNEKNKNCDVKNSQHVGISINNNGGVFCVILIGIGLAGLTLLVEYWWYRYRGNKPPTRVTNVTTVHRPQVNRRIKYRSKSLRKKPQPRPRYIYYFK